MRRRVLRQVPIKLLDVKIIHSEKTDQTLYDLLKERSVDISISHRKMPSWGEHVRFVDQHPYRCWYLIEVENEYVGSIYLSMQDEIGIFVFAAHQGRGFGTAAIRALIERYPRPRYTANINPKNERSAKMFRHLGFKLIQHTYELL